MRYAILDMKKLMNQIDSIAILEKLELEDDRTKVSLYLSKGVYSKFKKACGKAPASRVMEELMKEFLENLKTRS
jgi:hypothetical protein